MEKEEFQRISRRDIKYLTLTQKNDVCIQYRQGRSMDLIAKDMQLPREAVQKLLFQMGLINRIRPPRIQKELNEIVEKLNQQNGTNFKPK